MQGGLDDTTTLVLEPSGTAGGHVLLLTGFVWGMTRRSASSASPSPINGKVILRLGWTAGPDNLNPFIGTTSSAFTVWYMNYDTLVGLNTTDMTPNKTTGLATGWTTSPDGKTWTFTIRQNAKWQDGVPLTAADVAWTYNYIVKNDIANWTSYMTSIVKATAVGDYTVRIVCSAPQPALLANLAEVPILPEHIWAKIPPKTAIHTLPNSPPIVGSGPFQCVQWKKSNYLVMQANKSYWGGAPHVDDVVFEEYTSADTMGEDMKSGAIDGCDGLLQAQMQMLSHVKGVQVQAGVRQRLRRARLQLLHRRPLAGQSRPQRLEVPPGAAVGDRQEQALRGRLRRHGQAGRHDHHRQLLPQPRLALDAAGRPGLQLRPGQGLADADGGGLQAGQRRPPRTIRASRSRCASTPAATTSRASPAASSSPAGCASSACKITFSTLDDGALESELYNTVKGVFTPNYDLFEWGWYNDVDPGPSLSYFTTAQINNWSDCAWSDPLYDATYKAQSTEMDPAKRLQLVYKCQQIIYQQSPYIPLAYSDDTEAWNTSRWTGWVQMPANVGNVVYPPYGYATYLSVRPKTGGGGTPAGLIGVLVVVGIVVVAAVGGVHLRARQAAHANGRHAGRGVSPRGARGGGDSRLLARLSQAQRRRGARRAPRRRCYSGVVIAVTSPLAALPAPVAVSLAQIVALVLLLGLLAAVAGVVVALVTDDRDPTTILAWLLVIALVPVLGIVLYFFIGRNYRRDTPERDRLRAEAARRDAAVLGPTYEANAGYTAAGRSSDSPAHRPASSPCMGRHVTGFPVLPADSVEVYRRGADKFARLLDEMAGAQRYIHLMYLIWERDELTARVTEILLERLAHGVKVRILYDWLSCFRYPKAELKRLAAAGAEVKPCYKRLAQLNYRNHMKIALIDGVGRVHRRHEHGPGVHRRRRALRGVARHLAAPHRPRRGRVRGAVRRGLALQQGAGRPAGARTCRRRRLPPGRRAARRGPALERGDARSSRSATPTSWCCWAARERVWIQSPYFVPDEPLMTAMCAAALSGTDVRLMMTGVPDRTLPFHAAHAYYKQLLDSGVKVYQYTAGFLHAKTVVGRRPVVHHRHLQLRRAQHHPPRRGLLRDLRRGHRRRLRRRLRRRPARVSSVHDRRLVGARPAGQVAQLVLAAVLAAALSRDGRSRAWAAQRGLAWAPAAGRDVA